MSLSVYDRFITDTDSGETIGGATLEVRDTLGVLQSLYVDRLGVAPAANAFTADANGRVKFYLQPGRYNMTATFTGGSIVYSDVLVSPDKKTPHQVLDYAEAKGLKSVGNGSIISAGDTLTISHRANPGEGGGGDFEVLAGDYTTEVAADTKELRYIAFDDDNTGAAKVLFDKSSQAGIYKAERCGWVGDGSTDNGDPQSTLDEISANGGGVVMFGDPDYLFDEFDVPEGVILEGYSPDHNAQASQFGTTLSVNGTVGGNCVQLGPNSSTCGLRNISVVNRSNAQVNSIVRSAGVLRPILKNVEAEFLTYAGNTGRRTITVTNAANNGSGLIRLTAAAHGFITDNIADVADVVGTTEANGPWKVTVVDANTVDLQDSTFSNAYVSGGTISSLGAGFLLDKGTSFETLYCNAWITSHTANSGCVVWDDSNAICIDAQSSIQGKYIPLRALGQGSFNTGLNIQGAIEGSYISTMRHEYVAGGIGLIDAVAPANCYIVYLAEFQKGQAISIPAGYWELGGAPATYNDGTNGTHNLYPVVHLGSGVNGFTSNATMRARWFDLASNVNVLTTNYKSHDTRSKPRLIARTNDGQSMTDFTLTNVDFDDQKLENDETTFTMSGATITVVESGTYRISAAVRVAAHAAASDFNFMQVVAGGTTFTGVSTAKPASNVESGADVNCTLTLAAGDTIVFKYQQGSGANRALTTSFEQNYCCIERT